MIAMSKPLSKLALIAALLAFVAGVAVITDSVASYAVALAGVRDAGADPDNVYRFSFMLMLVFILLTTLPLLMIIAYRGLQAGTLSAKVRASLSLCALDDSQVQERVLEYESSNSLGALFLPATVNLLLLYMVWDSAIFPCGVPGVIALMLTEPHGFSLGLLFSRSAAQLTPLTWTLLGAYFYSVSLIMQRWMLADLTTNVIWKINVRLVVTFVLGLLLMSLASGPDRALHPFGASLAGLAFLTGIVPDLFLRWVSQQVQRLGGIDAEGDGRLFARSELQDKVDGLSFWQVDRLAEEGIESIQDLAMKDLPSLLIKTRFDPSLLFNWVDRALLCQQVDDDLERFKRAHCYTATDLMALVADGGGEDLLLRSLADAAPAAPAAGEGQSAATPLTAPIIANIIAGLANGPNLRYLTNYRANVNAGPAAVMAPLPAPGLRRAA